MSSFNKFKLLNKNLLQSNLFISGSWIPSRSTYNIINPSTNELFAAVSNADRSHAKEAITAAHHAFKTWSKTTARDRSNILSKWNLLIRENANDLAMIMTAEAGKPLHEAKGEIAYGNAFVKWFSEEAVRSYGETIPSPSPGKRMITIKQPVGVCALITPWNFPSAMITRKAAAALAAGCTVVIKPSAETPFSALALAYLAKEAGLPDGVLNIVCCSKENTSEVGKEFTSNNLVKKLSFTGSTAVGKMLMSQCSSTLKKLSLELGGNSPFIVFKDADIDKAVTHCIAAKFRNSGQTCVSVNRIFVQSEVYDEFTRKLVEKVKRLKTGDGFSEEDMDIGPLISKDAVSKVVAHVEDAVSKGGKVLHGGCKRTDLGENFFEPTVVGEATIDMKVFEEETFGPLMAVFKFKSEKECLEMANDSKTGLAGYFFSRDIARIFRVAEALEVGMVGVNEGMISTEVAPFGGVKESGFGREGSKYGIAEYQNIKYICIGGMAECKL